MAVLWWGLIFWNFFFFFPNVILLNPSSEYKYQTIHVLWDAEGHWAGAGQGHRERCRAVPAAVAEEGRGAAVAIALMSGATANVWLVILPFRSLPLARGAQRGRRDSHIFQREERSQQSRLIGTCVGCPCPTKAAFKRETQCYLMSCEMRHCC